VTPRETYITDDMRGLLDKTMHTQTAFPIDKSDIRKWAMAVYYPNVPPREFWDEEYAAATVWQGIVAPEELNPFTWMVRDPLPVDALVGGGGDRRFGDFEGPMGVDPPPYRAVLQGQVIATYSEVRMRPGDVISARTYISDYFERTGRMGLQLYTTVSVDFTNQNDEWIKRLDTVFVRYE
jgi:hypothetical protein